MRSSARPRLILIFLLLLTAVGCRGWLPPVPRTEAAFVPDPLLIGPGVDSEVTGEEGLADIAILQKNGYYYFYGTGSRFARMKSLSADSVQILEHAFEFESPDAVPGAWAFCPHERPDGTIHGYAGIDRGDFNTEIGHFVPAEGESWTPGNPVTRWKLSSVLIGDVESGHHTYDPFLFEAADGTLYMLYVVEVSPTGNREDQINVIRIQRMLGPDRIDPAFQARTLLAPEGYRSEDRNYQWMQLVEGPRLYHINGKYILFYSVGAFDKQNYKIAFAWSDTLLPPEGQTYRKVTVPDPQNVWGNPHPGDEIYYLLQSQERRAPNYVGEHIHGPGIANILHDDAGQTFLVFHGRLAKPIRAGGWSGRLVWILPLTIRVSETLPPTHWFDVSIPADWQQ